MGDLQLRPPVEPTIRGRVELKIGVINYLGGLTRQICNHSGSSGRLGEIYTPWGLNFFTDFLLYAHRSHGRAKPLRLVFHNMCSHERRCLLGLVLILDHLGGNFSGGNINWGPDVRNPII